MNSRYYDEAGSDHEYGDDDDLESYAAEDYGDQAEEDEESTVRCPNCKREIHEDAYLCPYCQTYLTEHESSDRWINGGVIANKPWWIIVTALVCLAMALYWALSI
jgi:RNA polymerase subunit RPABC4/transcription elongation factor Spt4